MLAATATRPRVWTACSRISRSPRATDRASRDGPMSVREARFRASSVRTTLRGGVLCRRRRGQTLDITAGSRAPATWAVTRILGGLGWRLVLHHGSDRSREDAIAFVVTRECGVVEGDGHGEPQEMLRREEGIRHGEEPRSRAAEPRCQGSDGDADGLEDVSRYCSRSSRTADTRTRTWGRSPAGMCSG